MKYIKPTYKKVEDNGIKMYGPPPAVAIVIAIAIVGIIYA